MTLELVVVEGTDQAERVPVHAGLVIGRRSDCDLTLANDTVSGRHARVVESGGALAIEDMGSQNKTIVEGGPTLSKGATHELRPGMTLILGKVKLRLEGAQVANPMATLADPGSTLAEGTLAETGADELLDLGDTAVERRATPRDPNSTRRDPEQERRQPPVDASAATLGPTPAVDVSPKDDSGVIPDWRMERPSGSTTAPPRSQHKTEGPGSEFVTIGLSPEQQGGAFEDLASQAALEAYRPRLVIDSDLARQIVDIRSSDFTIGREGCSLNVNHGAVSGKHAKIVFDPTHKRLHLVDLESKNFTILSGELVSPDVPRELAPHSHLRVGPIDLLFVIDKDYDGETFPAEVLSTAAEILETEGAITHEQRTKAESSARADKRHVGEMLILAGAVDAKRWVRALEHARLALVSRSLPNPQLQQLRLAVMALSVAVLILFVLVFVL